MDLGLAGRHPVVIGGSAGLGYAVCAALAAEGADVLILAPNPDRLIQHDGGATLALV